MIRFKSFFESVEDHEYFKSMPREHLHAETHKILTQHGWSPLEASASTDAVWSGNYSSIVFPDVSSHLSELGWRRNQHVNEYDSKYDHPNGAVLRQSGAAWIMKGVKKIDESTDEDHEYFKSMPWEHLHAETHHIMINHHHKVGRTAHSWGPDDDPIWGDWDRMSQVSDKMTAKMRELGWKPKDEHEGIAQTFHHPNGSKFEYKSFSASRNNTGEEFRFTPPKKVNESTDEDHEYWASMPYEHLHAETHALVTQSGWQPTEAHPRFPNTHTWQRVPGTGSPDYSKLPTLGWKRTGSERYQRVDHSCSSWKHPNGAEFTAAGPHCHMFKLEKN